MKIVCSSNMPYAREAFGSLGETVILDGVSITAEDVRDADILAIRSTTEVNRALLERSSVKFAGTATVGTDHLDTAYLDSKGIGWCYAPGCNANSVSEYVTAALLCLANRHGFILEGKTIGVIGVGNIGSLVVEKAEALGMRVLLNDPPRQRTAAAVPQGGTTQAPPTVVAPKRCYAEPRRRKASPRRVASQGSGEQKIEFVSLDRVLEQSDIVTLHVPLTREGPDATFHMADDAFFAKMKPSCVFLNSARGAVSETNSLLKVLDKGIVSHAVVDTWEGEPAYRNDLLERIDIGTPHIAGHSFEGKVMGTVMVYREVCRFIGSTASWSPDDLLPAPVVPELEIDAAEQQDEEALLNIVRRVYDIEKDDQRLRESCTDDEKVRAADFDLQRRDYPVRREFRFTRVTLRNASMKLVRKVSGLGFTK